MGKFGGYLKSFSISCPVGARMVPIIADKEKPGPKSGFFSESLEASKLCGFHDFFRSLFGWVESLCHSLASQRGQVLGLCAHHFKLLTGK